jgi:ABC-type glycerol-3-phosphate transport system substrate-binding protein
MVYINTSGEEILDPEMKTITFAHWQLEDGFREGYAEAIKEFEKLKATQGQKVKVIQTTVPVRGYRQWFLTQLISGNPADLMELHCSSEVRNQYFTPLSQYISKPNPFNKGTVFENVPWKDTYIDGMDNALDTAYAEYFGIGTYFHVYRLFVNLDLLEKATGSRELPRTLNQWLEACRKLKEYGEKIGKPVIPIGVRGFDKATISYLFRYYFNQLNGDLVDGSAPVFATGGISPAEVLNTMAEKKTDNIRLLTAVDIVKQLGQYFSEGFTSTDLEQTKFLFFTGRVGFFPEGTWNAYSMVKNSPFEVGITMIPAIGPDSPYYKYFTGVPGEQGGSSGLFGIPKACKNFDLSLEFLQFITSWKVSQRVMIDYCKWPTPVRNSTYKGIMKHFEPRLGKGYFEVGMPFYTGNRTKSQTNALNALEAVIQKDIDQNKEYFWNTFLEQNTIMHNELKEVILSSLRKSFSMEGLRTRIQTELMNCKPDSSNASLAKTREKMVLESVIFNMWQIDTNNIAIEALRKIRQNEKEDK